MRLIGLVLAFAISVSLLSCSGGSAAPASGGSVTDGNTVNSSPGGAPPNGSPSNPSQYLFTANNGSGNLSEFRINSDGTLGPVATITHSGQPFFVSAAKDLLLVGASATPHNELLLYRVSPSTGNLSLVSSTATGGDYAILDPSAEFAYVAGGTAANPNATVSAYSVADSKFVSLPGSPYQFSIGGGSNPVIADLIQLDPQGRFLFMPLFPQDSHTETGWFGAAIRNSDGTIGAFAPGSPIETSTECVSAGSLAVVAAQNTTTLVFQSCNELQTFGVLIYAVNQTTGAITIQPGFGEPTGGGLAKGLAVDPSGRWLAATDINSNTVHIIAIDAAHLALNETPGHVFTTGNGPNAVAFDRTGRFLYVLNGGSFQGIAGSNNISAYAFDTSTGNLTALPGSPYSTGTLPTALVIAQPQ